VEIWIKKGSYDKMTENETTAIEVYNADGLLQALKRKETFIAIKGDYKSEVRNLIRTKFSDKELMGFELGSAGTIGIMAELFYQIANFFSNEPEEKKQIESRLRRYNMRISDDNEMILYLRDLDY